MSRILETETPDIKIESLQDNKSTTELQAQFSVSLAQGSGIEASLPRVRVTRGISETSSLLRRHYLVDNKSTTELQAQFSVSLAQKLGMEVSLPPVRTTSKISETSLLRRPRRLQNQSFEHKRTAPTI